MLEKKCTLQEKQLADISQRDDETPSKKGVPLPPKFDGSVAFESYLVQFETIAGEQRWTADKKQVVLLGRLKGKALEVAVQGESRGFNDLVQRLRRHFSPDHEEMYAQQLHALKKKAGQSWEDLAFEVRELTRRAYKSANDSVRERLAVRALIDAIQEDIVRQKVRDAHPETLSVALQKVRQVEADLVIETQLQRGHKGEKKDSAKVVETLEEQVRQLQTDVGRKTPGNADPGQPGARRSPAARGRGRGRGAPRGRGRCLMCDSPEHWLRSCPMRLAWVQYMSQQGAQQGVAGTTNLDPRAPPFKPLN